MKQQPSIENSCCTLSPKESVEGADTVLRGSVRAPEGFSKGKPEAANPRGRSPRGFAAKGLPKENPMGALTLPLRTVSVPLTLSLGDSFPHCPSDFQQSLSVYTHLSATVYTSLLYSPAPGQVPAGAPGQQVPKLSQHGEHTQGEHTKGQLDFLAKSLA